MNNEEVGMGSKVGVLKKDGAALSKVKARGVSREWKSVRREERRDRVGMSEMGKEVVRLSKAERAFMSKKLGGGTVAECVKAAGWKGASEGNMSANGFSSRCFNLRRRRTASSLPAATTR